MEETEEDVEASIEEEEEVTEVEEADLAEEEEVDLIGEEEVAEEVSAEDVEGSEERTRRLCFLINSKEFSR